LGIAPVTQLDRVSDF